MKPRCFNRPPLSPGLWAPTGRRLGTKPVLRFYPSSFDDRCVSWDAPDLADSVPAREEWNCFGCRWLPPQAYEHLAPAHDPLWGTQLNVQAFRVVDDDPPFPGKVWNTVPVVVDLPDLAGPIAAVAPFSRGLEPLLADWNGKGL